MSTGPVFALDIGTRTVIGVVLAADPSGYKIVAAHMAEHRERSMYDGQIHDVKKVARVVGEVKSALEKRLKKPLTHAAVAAAGRALKTLRATATSEFSIRRLITPEEVTALELQAVQNALQIARKGKETPAADYYCVGYSVVRYLLEGTPIANPAGQRGKDFAVEVLATFLPRVVVDSLLSVLDENGLNLLGMTLEPIAAAHVVIPSTMRQINLALVDIGAGTSDIALTRDGSFFAYGMVPFAGDEVTEALCQKFLLDFPAGEKMKKDISVRESLIFTDFLGMNHALQRGQVLQAIDGIVDELASAIAAEILTLNERPPQAVVLVGGGSLTPLLPEKLAEKLGLSRERVAVRDKASLSRIKGGGKVLAGPEAITPIGIGVNYLERGGLHLFTVKVNGTSIPLFGLKNATVGDALLAAGVSAREMVGLPGPAVTFELDGQLQIVKGGEGRPAEILVNGQPADIHAPLSPHDEITFRPGINGEPAKAPVVAFLPPSSVKNVRLNGQPVKFQPVLLVNGEKMTDGEIPDGAKVKFVNNEGLFDLLKQESLYPTVFETDRVVCREGGQETPFLFPRYTITVDGAEVRDDFPLKGGEDVRVVFNPQPGITAERFLSMIGPRFVEVVVNGTALSLPRRVRLLVNGRPITGGETIPWGETVELVEQGSPILADLFLLLNLETQSSDFMLVMEVNGRPAEYTTPLQTGDRIQLGWVSKGGGDFIAAGGS